MGRTRTAATGTAAAATTTATAAAGRGRGGGGRSLDAVYDSTYLLSSDAELSRAAAAGNAQRAAQPGASKQGGSVASAENMFSELQHHPRSVYRPPAHVAAAAAHGQAQAHGQTQPQPAPLQARAQQAQSDYAKAQPTGRDLFRFLTNPMSGVGGAGLDQTAYRLDFGSRAQTAAGLRDLPPGTAVTTATQTDYRESETQTDPWTPDYVVRPGSAPEVLTLATLSHGHGLPAGLAEVEMIERARARRAWEANLPPADDPYRALERAKALEEQEMLEWKYREEEIQRVQEERLLMLKQLVADLQEQKQTEQDERLNRVYQQRHAELNRLLARTQREGVKRLRKLSRERREVEGSVQRRNIVREYADPASATFAPVARKGGSTRDRHGDRYRVDSRHLSTFEGLSELEASLPPAVTTPTVRQTQRRTMGGTRAATQRRMQNKLREFEETLSKTKAGTLKVLPPITCVERVVKPKERPSTPEVQEPAASAQDRQRAIILLQSIIRGRAIQNEMYEGKERRRDLIAELRSTHALLQAEQAIKAQEEEKLKEHRERQALEAHKRSAATWAMADVQADNVGSALDYLSKELVRLQEERRIHAFAMLAERERRMREAEEAGRRQLEELRRRQNDEIFRGIVDVHRETIESYLEDVILDAQEETASDQARLHVREQVSAINRVADDLHASGYDQTESGAHTIAANLVHSFLLPEVQKQAMRDSVQRDQRKYIAAAHAAVRKDVADVEEARRVSFGKPGSAGEGDA